jgi:lysophospholipase L1-like esterase
MLLRLPALVLATALSATFASAPAQAADPERLAPFFDLLSSIESKKLDRVAKIAWYGDSAVISDGYTGTLRGKLQARFGDGGPGFILAAATFDDYLRAGVRMKRQGWEAQAVISDGLKTGFYGFGGVVSTSFGGASTSFEVKDPSIRAVEVWYQAGPKAGKLQIFVDGAAKPDATWNTDAAETGEAVWRFTPEKPAKSIKVRAAGEGLVRVFGVVLDRDKRGVQLDSVGILGMRARRWLNADKDHLKRQVAQRAPDLIVLNFGGNERVDESLSKSSHKADIEKTLTALKAGAPKAACLIVGPLAHGEEKNGKIVLDADLVTIYEAQREAATAQGCGFLDLIEAMGGKKALSNFRDKKLISGDFAHLTNKGHEAVGALISDWLLSRYDAYRKL